MFHMLFKGPAVYHDIIEVNNKEREGFNVERKKKCIKLQKVAGALVRPKSDL